MPLKGGGGGGGGLFDPTTPSFLATPLIFSPPPTFITTYVACYTVSLSTETDLSRSDCSIRVSRIIDAWARVARILATPLLTFTQYVKNLYVSSRKLVRCSIDFYKICMVVGFEIKKLRMKGLFLVNCCSDHANAIV